MEQRTLNIKKEPENSDLLIDIKGVLSNLKCEKRTPVQTKRLEIPGPEPKSSKEISSKVQRTPPSSTGISASTPTSAEAKKSIGDGPHTATKTNAIRSAQSNTNGPNSSTPRGENGIVGEGITTRITCNSTTTSSTVTDTAHVSTTPAGATSSAPSQVTTTTKADSTKQSRAYVKPVRKRPSNIETAPGGFIFPADQNVWRSVPFTSFSKSSSKTSESRKRKNRDSESEQQQPAKSTKPTAEARPGTASQTSESNVATVTGRINVRAAAGSSVPMLQVHSTNKEKFSIRIRLPAKEYPWVNFVGKMIGIKGSTIKQLQELTNCRLTVRGKGAKYDCGEDSHVLAECFTTTADAYSRFARVLSYVQEIVKPDSNAILLLQSWTYSAALQTNSFGSGFRHSWQTTYTNCW